MIWYALSNSSGLITFNLQPASYRLQIESGRNDDADQIGTGSQVGSDNDKFSFSITSAAPEPSSWALMFVSIGAIGLMLDRQKKTTNAFPALSKLDVLGV